MIQKTTGQTLRNTVIKILNKIKYISIQEDSTDKCDLLKVCMTSLTLEKSIDESIKPTI